MAHWGYESLLARSLCQASNSFCFCSSVSEEGSTGSFLSEGQSMLKRLVALKCRTKSLSTMETSSGCVWKWRISHGENDDEPLDFGVPMAHESASNASPSRKTHVASLAHWIILKAAHWWCWCCFISTNLHESLWTETNMPQQRGREGTWRNTKKTPLQTIKKSRNQSKERFTDITH